MILIGLVIIITVLIVLAVPHIWRKLTIPDARSRSGSPSVPDATSGEIMTAVTLRDLDAADRLALARLDDDGAPPAPTPPKSSDIHDLHAPAPRTPALPGTG